MPDMMLPQVAPAPAPAKPSKGPEQTSSTQEESSKDQGFSGVLKKRMETDDADPATRSQVVSRTEASPAKGPQSDLVEAEDGNQLPEPGKLAESILAALKRQEGADSELSVEALPMELQALLAPLVGQDEKGLLKPERGQGARTDWLQGRLNAWAALLHADDRPEAARSPVAQAVQEAMADSDVFFNDALLTRFGADLRSAVNTSQQRNPGLETIFDRLASNPQVAQNNGTPSLGLQAVMPQETSAARAAQPAVTIDVPFRQAGWDQAISERVVWLANQKIQGAEIKLNPPQLGPIEVRIQMHQDQAQVSFTANHASVREALEAALPRLREMFAANGLDLGDVNVSQHSFAEQQRQMQGSDNGKFRAEAGSLEDLDEAPVLEQGVSAQLGLTRSAIDLFA